MAARQAFQSLKRLTLFLFYTTMPNDRPNPSWEVIGYSGPLVNETQVQHIITPLAVTADSVLDADVVVIGSGAGGGVVAGELAMAGHDVVVLEKGQYFSTSDFNGRELDGNVDLYEKTWCANNS